MMLAKLACLLTAAVLVAETLPLLVTMDGIPVGELRPSCDLRDPACTDIPSGGIAGAMGMDRDCGSVNAVGLAECLDLEVIPHPEGYRLILRTRKGGWRPEDPARDPLLKPDAWWRCAVNPDAPNCDENDGSP